MTTGYAGKIVRIDLTNGTASVLDTEKYEEFGGGYGIATALFWEFCQDKTISSFDPGNVLAIMTSPLSGTLVPGAGRMEMCGIGPYSYPVEWFNRSNIGGFFEVMLKYAGWDGIVIEGKADKPVWINILNDKITFEDASGLWGMDTIDTQNEIWKRVTGKESFGDWLSLGDARTTQGPSIMCIGPGGESLSRMGTIQSGCSMSASQGGFGAVWGAKNLKAISVVGTGGIKVADVTALFNARKRLGEILEMPIATLNNGRQTSCAGCFQKCKARSHNGLLNDAQCLGMLYVTDVSDRGKSGPDVIETYGLNMNDLASAKFTDGVYIKRLYDAGILGPGKAIDSAPLPMEIFESANFTEALCRAIVNREGIGADLAEGLMRAAEKWGRLEQDLAKGWLRRTQWGYGWHWNVPFVEQGYGSLMGERDITEHFLAGPESIVDLHTIAAKKYPAAKLVEMLSKKMIPYENDPFMFDHNWQEADGSNMKQALETGIYSRHKAKLVAWHCHYTRFWEESALLCDCIWPVIFDRRRPDFSGCTPECEPELFNAVTGKKLTFAESMETGRKIWNISRAIWALQGRHRDMEHFAEFMYTPQGSLKVFMSNFPDEVNVPLPVYQGGKWVIGTFENMYLDKAGVEQWKTHFYELEGWDTATGRPTRKTLEELGLKDVADTLKSAGKLGSPD